MMQYYKPPTQKLMDDFLYQPPWDLIKGVMEKAQGEYDMGLATTEALKGALQVNHIDNEVENQVVKDRIEYYEDQIDMVTNEIKSTGKTRELMPKLQQLGKELQEELKTGVLGRAQSSYATDQKMISEINRLEEKGEDTTMAVGRRNYFNQQFRGSQEEPTRGSYNTSMGYEAMAVPPEFMTDPKAFGDWVKTLVASSYEIVGESPSGMYLVKTEQGDEVLSAERIQALINSAITSTPGAQNYLRQAGMFVGDTSLKEGLYSYDYTDESGKEITKEQAATIEKEGGKINKKVSGTNTNILTGLYGQAEAHAYSKSSRKQTLSTNAPALQTYLQRDSQKHAFDLAAQKHKWDEEGKTTANIRDLVKVYLTDKDINGNSETGKAMKRQLGQQIAHERGDVIPALVAQGTPINFKNLEGTEGEGAYIQLTYANLMNGTPELGRKFTEEEMNTKILSEVTNTMIPVSQYIMEAIKAKDEHDNPIYDMKSASDRKKLVGRMWKKEDSDLIFSRKRAPHAGKMDSEAEGVKRFSGSLAFMESFVNTEPLFNNKKKSVAFNPLSVTGSIAATETLQNAGVNSFLYQKADGSGKTWVPEGKDSDWEFSNVTKLGGLNENSEFAVFTQLKHKDSGATMNVIATPLEYNPSTSTSMAIKHLAKNEFGRNSQIFQNLDNNVAGRINQAFKSAPRTNDHGDESYAARGGAALAKRFQQGYDQKGKPIEFDIRKNPSGTYDLKFSSDSNFKGGPWSNLNMEEISTAIRFYQEDVNNTKK